MKSTLLAMFLGLLGATHVDAKFFADSEGSICFGNSTISDTISLGFAELSLAGHVKRQQCQADYGSCPGNSNCYSLSANIGCCGSQAIYKTDTCCQGDYSCDAGEECCQGNGNQQNCMPAGSNCCANGRYCASDEKCCLANSGAITCIPSNSNCCSDGGYCDPGEQCVIYDGETIVRCRGSGSSNTVPDNNDPSTASTQAPATTTRAPVTTTSYEPTETTSYYTITFTVYYYYYYYTSYTSAFQTTTRSYSNVASSYTSSETPLSISATDEYQASDSLLDQVSSIEDSLSEDGLTSSRSMSSVVSKWSSSYSSRQFASSTYANNGGGSVGGGSASAAHAVHVRDSLSLAVAALVAGTVGGLMIVL